MLLSTNDKVVKLWRVKEMPNRRFVEDKGAAQEGGVPMDCDENVECGLANSQQSRVRVPKTETQVR